MKHYVKTIDLDNCFSLNVGVKYEKKQYSNEDTGHNVIDESEIELVSLELVIVDEPPIEIKIDKLSDYAKNKILKLIEI
jgi:hypothetical protein